MEQPYGPWPIRISWYRYPDRFLHLVTARCYGYEPTGELVGYESSLEVSEATLALSNLVNMTGGLEHIVRDTVIGTMQTYALVQP